MLEQFSATIDLLYAAAFDGTLWDQALSAIEALSGSAGVVVNIVDKAEPERSKLLNSKGIAAFASEKDLATYNQDVLPHCPRVAWGALHPDTSYVCDYMILSEAEMDRDLAYDWYARHGLRYFVGSPLFETCRYHFMWSFQRTPSQGHVQAEEVELFRLLKPHVERALRITDQLSSLQRDARSSSAVLEGLPNAVFTLDRHGNVLTVNAAGAALLAGPDGLQMRDGKLLTWMTSEQCRLERAIADAAASPPVAGQVFVRLSRGHNDTALAAFVAPLNIADEELLTLNAKVLVIIHDTDARGCAKTEMLTSLYGLTDAEARLASALSGGHSIESAAALLNIRPATARSELKSVFRKTGVSRQQDLVRLLTALASVSKA